MGKSNVTVSGHVSSHHSIPNRERMFFCLFVCFFRGAGVQGLDGDESNHQTLHESPD